MLKDIEGLLWLGHAYTVNEAIDKINTQVPDLILLDIKIKEQTGFEVLEFLNVNYPETTTIIISNFTTEPYKKKSYELGAKYFLDKSQEFEKLSDIINELISQRK